MPRKPRIPSATGIYHIVLRGVNRRQIFVDDDDYDLYIKLLKRYKLVSEYKLYAYCLMGNHIHLLLRVGSEPLQIIFRRIGAAFSYSYNGKYNRVGHIFQDRFFSEPVENPSYFLRVIRYILQNPVKAGICDKPEDYRYSNAYELLNEQRDFTDSDEIFDLITPEGLREYCKEKNDDICLEIDSSKRITVSDSQAEQLILKEFGTLSPDPGRGEARQKFFSTLSKIYKNNVSMRQFSRITGVSRYILLNN